MTHEEYLKMIKEQYDEDGNERNQVDLLAQFRMTPTQYDRYINMK